MLGRRMFLALSLTAAAAAMSAPAFADPAAVAFTPEAFKAAQAAGKPILVAIHASWCPTCKIQGVILKDLYKKPEFKDLTVFRVDFDAQKAIVAGFGADSQSTLIVFKGGKEMGRSVGDVSSASIEAMLKTAI